jgi:6-pyruvoyltetrahydropterin/6-carboxytetrahydropterin synthase
MQAHYRVRVTKDHLVFSAAHFITYNGNVCERLHGHNWRVAVEVAGPLDENQYVYDFIALRDAVQAIVGELDHRMLLPMQHPAIRVTSSKDEIEVRFEDRRWVFPVGDCVLLPVENTTAERLAWWIGGRLRDRLRAGNRQIGLALRVEVEENFGQWGICEFAADGA